MTKPRIASSGESYLLRRAEQAEAENARLRQQVAELETIRARLEAWGADATIQLDATHRVTVSTAAMVEEAISAATNWQDNAERAGVRVAELVAAVRRALPAMIRVGNALNWDGEIANDEYATAINFLRYALGLTELEPDGWAEATDDAR